MTKITKEVAAEDFDRFLAALRVDPIKKKKLFLEDEDGVSMTNAPLELIEEGMMIVLEDGSLEYKLLEPISADSGNVVLDSLTFKPKRITIGQFEKINEIKNDVDKMKEILSLLTGVSKGFIQKLSLDDLGYITTITSLFM